MDLARVADIVLAGASPPGGSGSSAVVTQVIFFAAIFAIFYFLLIRPQQQKARQHREMLSNVRRGDTIVTNGGYRNARWTVADAPCDCQRPNNVVMTCIADLAYSCRWEMKVTERIEICG